MFYVIIIFWIIFDLYTKYLSSIYLQQKINIVWDFLYFSYVENTWIAFSIQLPIIFLKLLTVFLIIAIFIYYYIENKKQKTILFDISFWLILAWAIANWYERIFNEKVIDFIWLKYFAVFNFADFFISIGALLYLFIYLNIDFKRFFK